MILAAHFLCVLVLAAIAKQDIRDRLVYWWLFPLLAILLGWVHFAYSPAPKVFLAEIRLNGLIVLMLIGILYAYARFVSQIAFVDHSMGKGDMLFFGAMAVGFPTLTFLVLLGVGLLFTLVLYLLGKRRWNWQTVPLAGLLSLFLLAVLLGGAFKGTHFLYVAP